MALFSRLRIVSLTKNHRHFSSILSAENSKTPLSSYEKTRAALSLLKLENNPEKIVEICKAASLTPETHLDRVVFSVAIEKLSKSKNFSYIQEFLDELRVSRSDLRSSERFASHAIVLYGKAGMIDDAIRTFKEYHTDVIGSGVGSVKVLNALIFACILARKFEEVNRIYVEFPKMYNIEPNFETYNTVIKAFSESGNSNFSYSILAEMENKEVKPNAATFGILLSGLYREEKYEDVGKMLEIMKDKYGIRQGVGIYNVRIQSLCKLKKSAEAKALLDEMLSRDMKPNSVTYCHLIHGFSREGNLEEAKKLFKSMRNRGLEPDSECYFTFLHFLCKDGDVETALEVCMESMGKGWVPNFATMKLLVNGLAGVGKIGEAKELIGKVKKRFTKNVQLWEEVEAGLAQ